MESNHTENSIHELGDIEALSFALKHLEFITIFELSLKEKNTHSSRFLKAFRSIKQEAQMNVLKYSTYCKK